MTDALRLLAVLAHPDDESMAVGGALAKYAAAGVETHLVTATRGERGRFFTNENRPSDREVGRVREGELRAAARELGIREVSFLDYLDGELDRADPGEAIARIVAHIRRVRPHVVVTFDPFGMYGHPDHVAICQFTTAAVAAAAHRGTRTRAARPHQVAKLYYTGWSANRWASFESAFRVLTTRADGQVRQAVPWPEWAVTTTIDARDQSATVWRAVRCHETQLAIYEKLGGLGPEQHEALWGTQTFYRAMSVVNGGRAPETDLFAGIRRESDTSRAEGDDEYTAAA